MAEHSDPRNNVSFFFFVSFISPVYLLFLFTSFSFFSFVLLLYFSFFLSLLFSPLVIILSSPHLPRLNPAATPVVCVKYVGGTPIWLWLDPYAFPRGLLLPAGSHVLIVFDCFWADRQRSTVMPSKKTFQGGLQTR